MCAGNFKLCNELASYMVLTVNSPITLVTMLYATVNVFSKIIFYGNSEKNKFKDEFTTRIGMWGQRLCET